MRLAPIALFVYNRPAHAQQAVEYLKRNDLAKDSDLFIFSDAPKDAKSEDGVNKVREYLKTISGFKDLYVIKNKVNFGLAKNIISGVSEVLRNNGEVIVIEDDLLVSPYFLKYMNEALAFYHDNDSVISICGYMYPANIRCKDTLFLRIPDTWGWATWKRGWDLLEPDGEKLMNALIDRRMMSRLNLEGAFDFGKMLRQQIDGKRDSWGVRWVASAVLAGKLSLFPAKSLVKNTGYDGDGSHCGYINCYDTDISNDPVNIASIPIEEDKQAVAAIRDFQRTRKFRFLMRMLLGCLKKNRRIPGR